MCEPTTIAIAGVAATVLATGVTVYGQMQAGQAAQNQADYQAAIARNNVIASQQAADQAKRAGDQATAQEALKGKQLLATQRATFAGNGVDANAGSALDIQGDTAGETKLNELTIQNNAERQAIGFQNQGATFNAQAAADTIAGDNAASNGVTGAAGSLLSGGGQVADKWYKFSQQFPGADPSLSTGGGGFNNS